MMEHFGDTQASLPKLRDAIDLDIGSMTPA